MTETTINWQPENLEDDVVKIIPLTGLDFECLYRVASDPLIWEQHPSKDRCKREVFQLYFDGAIAAKTAFLIIEKSSGNIIGCTRYYDYKPEHSSIAIGYTFLARQYWGGLYNRASKNLLLDYAFQYVDSVSFHIAAENVRSQLATAKIGAVKVGEVVIDHYGQDILHFEYRIQKRDWAK